MKDDPNREDFEKERFADELIQFAREYHASGFHVVDSSTCPPSKVLSRIVTSKSLPDEHLRTHLLACSRCFQEFRSLREEFAAGSTVGLSQSDSNPGSRKVGVMVASAAAVFLIFSLSYLFIFRDRNSSQAAIPSTPSPSSSVASDASTPEVAQTGIDAGSATNTNSQEEVRKIRTVDFDLARVAVSRNASEETALMTVPAEKIRMQIKLRPGSQAGTYRLGLLDEFGKTLSAPVSVRSSGRTVSAVMDLTTHIGHSRLCVFYGDEIPDCIPLEVTGPR